jgi:hypothetical protein
MRSCSRADRMTKQAFKKFCRGPGKPYARCAQATGSLTGAVTKLLHEKRYR